LPIKIVIHDKPVPPDPGDAGKATLEGIDSDADGVRDDIQRYIISSQFCNMSLTDALFQLTKIEQRFLIAPHEEELLGKLDDQRTSAHDCLEHFAGPTLARRLVLDLKAEMLNTAARSEAYFQALKVKGARPFFLKDESALKAGCAF
jgi:hypothetical protein